MFKIDPNSFMSDSKPEFSGEISILIPGCTYLSSFYLNVNDRDLEYSACLVDLHNENIKGVDSVIKDVICVLESGSVEKGTLLERWKHIANLYANSFKYSPGLRWKFLAFNRTVLVELAAHIISMIVLRDYEEGIAEEEVHNGNH